MAMFLKLEASDPVEHVDPVHAGDSRLHGLESAHGASRRSGSPSGASPFTVVAIPLVPGVLAFVLGAAMFRRRVGGVYFAIITQAVAAILSILIIGRQGYTGGVNGITDLKTLHGWDIRSDSAQDDPLLRQRRSAPRGHRALASRSSAASSGAFSSRVRDREERVLFTGYDVANIKTFVFVLAAVYSAVGGAMFTLQVGFMSPSFVGIVPSIEMVIAAAVGGRASLLGAVYGTLLVNYGKTYFSESFPELWLFLIGALFIAVVMIFPNGLAGIDLSRAVRRASAGRAGSAASAPARRRQGAPDRRRAVPPPPASRPAVDAGGQ